MLPISRDTHFQQTRKRVVTSSNTHTQPQQPHHLYLCFSNLSYEPSTSFHNFHKPLNQRVHFSNLQKPLANQLGSAHFSLDDRWLPEATSQSLWHKLDCKEKMVTSFARTVNASVTKSEILTILLQRSRFETAKISVRTNNSVWTSNADG